MIWPDKKKKMDVYYPRDPISLSVDDWGVQSPSQQNIEVPLPFLEGDWIPRVNSWMIVKVVAFQSCLKAYFLEWSLNLLLQKRWWQMAIFDTKLLIAFPRAPPHPQEMRSEYPPWN